jgi:hypothetical protein
MTQPSPPTSQFWQQIVGEDLSAVSFIRDYIRFEFNSPLVVDALTKTVVTVGGSSAALGDPAFANLAIGLIGRVAEGICLEANEALTITFVGGALIWISLRAEDSIGPEAVLLHGPGHQLAVFP